MEQLTISQTLAEQLDFDKDTLKVYSSVHDIKRLYPDDVLIWVNASGGDYARYRVVLEYKGKTRFLTDKVGERTANQAMILGLTDAVNHLTKPVSICTICSTELGFKKGLKGKGPNGKHILSLANMMVEKGCTLTEVYLPGGGDLIKQYIAAADPERKVSQVFERQKERKDQYREAYWAKYKEEAYAECIGKVTKVLQEQGIDVTVIKMVKEVKP